MTSLRERFAITIRRRRIEAQFSQEGFAAAAFIDRGHYGRIERGKANVSLDHIERIAAVLDVTVGTLMTEADEVEV